MGGFKITNPLGADNLQDIFAFIADRIVEIIIPIAAMLYVYAGVMFFLSGNNPGNLKKAKDILLYTSIGLVVIFIGGGFVDLIRSILNAAGSGN